MYDDLPIPLQLKCCLPDNYACKAILHSDSVAYVKSSRKLTRVADKITPSGRELRIITADYAS
jgi:hypothetical protein